MQLSLLFLAGLVCVSLLSALAAANSVPATRADLDVRSIGPNDFKPPACASMTLTSLVLGSGTINGSNANDLILGSNVDDSIKGKAGGDCLLGGGGNDDLAGDGGLDVCIGGQAPIRSSPLAKRRFNKRIGAVIDALLSNFIERSLDRDFIDVAGSKASGLK